MFALLDLRFQESEFAAWMRFLPFVALFLFTFLGRLFTPSPVYSLSSKGYVFCKCVTIKQVHSVTAYATRK